MTPELTAEQAALWAQFQAETGIKAPLRGVDAFGDSPEMMDELLALVLSRTKQATASLARWFVDDPLGLPKPGDLWLITDGRGSPACVTRTTRVDVMPIHQVDAEFAWVEGEGDRSYAYWITEHRKFWRREAAREGFEYSDDLDVVCERFELVWSPDQPE
ncbi:MAG: ASCH domain-containing protein [Oceanicaulis sp.]|uniref:ASCH domain-containing protein n=1 Tax=Oceanicaulis sp. UBA2681 TaxID=1947007 RepID=UPI000C0A3BA9|nr:ASCH domain-containing protein [Oceanicaulis sp. UBA2681]MAP48340.1 ASCH domain-containing protein [Oceanicaulis sp.]HCR66770.1 ASCH domain-containing protein [Oceanicaulis sp.]|tara:strand:- start:1862 stop:2341 length:480 start_codon:yes stop_codon:yes gene_type:complete